MYNSTKLINQYQLKLSCRLSGLFIESALKELGIEPSPQRVSYVLALLSIKRRKDKECEPTLYLQIPVEYLFSAITPFSPEDYYKSVFKTYMGTVTRNSIQPLQSVISVTQYREDYCRRFMIKEELLSKIVEKETKYMNVKLPPVELIKYNMEVGNKPAKWGGRELTVKQLPSVTKAAWQKLKFSKFRFDFDLFYSDKGRLFNSSLKLSPEQNSALIGALDHIQNTTKPQYHDSFFIQKPGRLHTRGGPMAMTSVFRRYFVKPINPDNISLEIDLKCAQLLILCDILQAKEVKDQIVNIIREGSVWNHIGSPNLPKQLKKIIIYGFCFGAKLYELPFLATQKAKVKYGLKYKVTSKDVDLCFSGLLKPLLTLRNNWLDNYTSDRIDSKGTDNTVQINSLGLLFNLEEELSEYRKVNRSKFDKYKIASRLLAHYCQGSEQLIIQSLIANSIEENILTYSYDGLTIEVKKDSVSTVKSRLDSWMEDNYIDYLLESTEYS